MMLTRCPACQTVFRLRPEQLHARGGEVRCGHCFHPFNALENRLAAAGDAPAARPPAASPPGTPPRPDPLLDFDLPEIAPAQPIRAPAPTPDVDDDWLLSGAPERIVPSPQIRAQEHPEAAFHSGLEARPEAADETPEPARSFPEVMRSGRRAPPAADPPAAAVSFHDEPFHDDPATAPAGPIAPPAAATSGAVARHGPVDHDDLAAEPDLAHLDATYGKPHTATHPLLRALATLVALALGALLAVQGAYLYRMEIARALPGLRPLLNEACARAGCTVPYPRDAESIAIEASDLQAEPGRPGHYLLQATLNNRAAYPQQWPQLELTLTDAGDNPLSRRVLSPADWLPPGQPSAAFPARHAIELRIPFEAPGVAPTGYRIYAFYP